MSLDTQQTNLIINEPLPIINNVTIHEKKDINDPNGDGFVGFVHNAVIDQYLSKHEAPEDIELYFCGPPMMNSSCMKMLSDLGVEDENVMCDDFGI